MHSNIFVEHLSRIPKQQEKPVTTQNAMEKSPKINNNSVRFEFSERIGRWFVWLGQEKIAVIYFENGICKSGIYKMIAVTCPTISRLIGEKKIQLRRLRVRFSNGNLPIPLPVSTAGQAKSAISKGQGVAKRLYSGKQPSRKSSNGRKKRPGACRYCC